ncbi:MAG: hypothetical protein U1E51_14200 [Candidatus Binatia bacterium]|nr:hypothetical protein [Candidatus Binatia bacterium]
MPNFPYTWLNLLDSSVGELNAEISAAATSLVLKSGQGIKFPASDFIVKCGAEVIHVATRSTDTCSSLTRGYDGTTAAIHLIDSVVFQAAGRSLFQRIYDNLAGHTHNKADIPDFSHNHAQGDVTNLVSDLAGKSATLHSHVAGDVTGTAVLTADSRLSDARVPLAHDIASSHNGFPGGTTNFLRADGAFAAPPGGGGVTKISGASGAFVADSTWLSLSANSTDNTTTTQVVKMTLTGVGVGTYRVKAALVFQAAATGTGIGIVLNHTGTVSRFVSNWIHITTGRTAATGISDQATTTAAGQLVEGKAERVKNTRSSFTVGVDSANADGLAIMDAVLIVTATGQIDLSIASEVAASAVRLMAGSTLELNRVA